MRILPTLALLLGLTTSFTLSGQRGLDRCDPVLLKAIFKRSLKAADARMDREYRLIAENIASIEGHEQLRKTHPVECTERDHWPSAWVDSERAVITARDSVGYMDHSCFISRPLFNQEGTDCVVVLSTHQSEWGGWTGYLHFKRKGGRWKYIRTSIVSIS